MGFLYGCMCGKSYGCESTGRVVVGVASFPRSATSSRAGDGGAGDGSSSSSSSSSSSGRAIERGFGTEEGGAETTRGVRIDSDLDLDWIGIFSLSRVGGIARSIVPRRAVTRDEHVVARGAEGWDAERAGTSRGDVGVGVV